MFQKAQIGNTREGVTEQHMRDKLSHYESQMLQKSDEGKYNMVILHNVISFCEAVTDGIINMSQFVVVVRVCVLQCVEF